MKKLYFIPISGRMGAGKTTFAKELAFYFKQFSEIVPHVYSYADALRMELVEAGVASDIEQLQDQSYKMKCLSDLERDIVIPNDFPMDITEETTVRQLMQWWGTEYRRAQHPFYWINKMQRRIEEDMLLQPSDSHAFICDDVRFPNELELFTSMARELPEGQRISIYLHHWKYTVKDEPDRHNGYIIPKSLLGGEPADKEHPSEFLLDLSPKCYSNVWDLVYAPSFRRIAAYAMMAYDQIMNIE